MGDQRTSNSHGFYFPKGSHGSKATCNGCGQAVYAMTDPCTGKQWLYEPWDTIGDAPRSNVPHHCPSGLGQPGAHLPSTPEQLQAHAKRIVAETARDVLVVKEQAREICHELGAMQERVQILGAWLARQPNTDRLLAIDIFRTRLAAEREALDDITRRSDLTNGAQ